MERTSQTCVSCESGKYQSTDLSTACDLCPMGTFSLVGSYGGCLFCLVDTYNTCGGMSYCEKCPLNSSTRGATGSVSCQCDPGFVDWRGCNACMEGTYEAGGKCLPCEVGKYNPNAHATTCLVCEFGKYTFANGSSSCTECTLGSVGNLEKKKCVCPTGFFNFSSTVGCLPCKTECSSSTQYLETMCYDEMDNVCRSCSVNCGSPNMYISKKCSKNADIECKPCAKECAKGFYRKEECNLENNLECQPCRATCPPWFIKTGICHTKDFQCVACEVGKYPGSSAQMYCAACPPQHYAHYDGIKYECRMCVGSFLMNANKTGCYESKCAPGEYPSGANECSFCPVNTYGVDGLTCQVCPPFYNCEKQRIGLSTCIPCKSVLDVDGIQSVEMNACPVSYES